MHCNFMVKDKRQKYRHKHELLVNEVFLDKLCIKEMLDL